MKASQIRDSYRDCLPKLPRVTFGNVFVGVTGCASLVGLFVAIRWPNQSASEVLFSGFLILLTLSCLTYTAIQAHKRLHRYSEAVHFYHYVNHTLRDYVAQVVFGEELDRDLADLLADVLTAVATCFSIVTGKQCRCCIKELKKDQEIITARRDNISATQAESQRLLQDKIVKHALENNTDFYKLWYAEAGHQRAYLANNLREDFRYGLYKNSSFEVLGEPKISSFLGHTYVKTWTLPYHSALVLPIRYISEFKPPCKKDGEQSENPQWKYWGFLCVDCKSRNVFDYRYAIELGGAFADLLYSFFVALDFATVAKSNQVGERTRKAQEQEQMPNQ